MQRIKFITQTGAFLAGLPLAGLSHPLIDDMGAEIYNNLINKKGDEPITNEYYWEIVRGMFNYSKDFINLENGYFSPQPFSTEQFHQNKEHYINNKTSWFMRRDQRDAIEQTRKNLSEFLGCDSEELILTRNTTEGLNTIISGYPWQKGDEVIIGNQDYGSMVAAFRQQEKRHGIEVKVAQIPLHPVSDEELVNAYLSLATAKTKIIHLTHMINLSGQLLPAKKIIAAAHARGIEVAVDAAHSVAQIDYKPGELGADYVAASLHKWMCCPLGAGFLIMNKKHIIRIWPLMGDDEFKEDNIRKFEHQGTKPPQTVMAISEAIRFHNAIGSKLKQDRLRYLRNYWVSKVKDFENVTMNTPYAEERGGAIANFSVKGYTPTQLADTLFKDHKIFTVAIDHPHIKGVRVTPHLFTSISDLDKLVDAIKGLS
ncbi:MAG: aminotransferase class V-fold PLP-dependent enzyme [Bacteroidia bacterium]